MVNLTAAIERITGRPHRLDGPYLICAEPGGDPYIATWDEAILGPRPTVEAIAAAALAVTRAAAHAKIKTSANAYIEKAYPVWKQSNVLRGVVQRLTAPPPALETLYSQDDLDRMTAYIDEARAVSNALEAALDAPEINTPEAVEQFMAEAAAQYGDWLI